MAKKKLKPINTGYVDSSFFDMSDFDIEVEWGRDYLESDIPATLLLYCVDYKKTNTHSLYGETKASQKVIKSPIELKVRYIIEESESNYIGDSGIVRHFAGDLIFTVYNKELEEKSATIRRGDFVGLMNPNGYYEYFEVFDADTMNISNNRTLAGLESFYKRIRCRVVDKDVFNI